jgi:nucleotide-binding universal stress UspA family protein
VTDRVVRASKAPVLVVRPQDARESFGPAHIFRIIVPLDGSERAEEALPIAEYLALRLHRPAVLIQVTPDNTLPVVAFGAVAAEVVAHDAALAAEHAAVQTLDHAAARLEKSGVAVTWDVEVGEPFERITETAKAGDLIVLASHGRSGVSRWMLGSVAEKLIRLADAPVLVVRASTPDAADEQPMAVAS